MMHCTQDGSLDNAMTYHKPPSQQQRACIAEKLLSTQIGFEILSMSLLSPNDNFKNHITIILV
jgi:hypothetical protein